ncbi:PP2C family protein-serine/threonine phosphatase [Streptomyces cylindrosporus]|uniref:SpoIIE family protein phosphatase n=1 Tax=Streptomyces cylindrosporus TaxID=2927583 RepID=A0ABS9YDQ8_9ACTN|nr:GAF domain-containing SpoIIE family protein phosphatase [Streptomyces cylindrosporus]MCI3275361.1 SpoIIE family protein phosphatase [Streptomyces cylindrosporus]
MTHHHIVACDARRGAPVAPPRGRPPTRKGTTLRNEPRSRTDIPATARPSPSRPAFSPAADILGSELDLRLTGDRITAALTPAFCDAASVYLLERWRREENAYLTADPPRIEVHRLALRLGAAGKEDWEKVLPVGEVIVFPRGTPHARALASGQAQLLDTVDTITVERLLASGDVGARLHDLLLVSSFLVVPLRLGETTIGFVVCTRGPDRKAFLPEEVAAVEELAARAAVALDNARRYERERRTALAIRDSLPHGTHQELAGCRVAHGSLPAGPDTVIGGDWFDVLERPGDRVSLIVGDAMGHGPESSVAMLQLRTAVRALASLDIPAADLVRRLDALACDTPGASFATCIYAEWDAALHTCTLVGAGHPPPLLRGPDGRSAPVPLVGAGLPLGLGTGHYEATVLTVPEPALLVLYSDGLVESRDADIDQEIARLARALDEAADGDGQDALPELCHHLLHAPSDAAGGDDRTLLLAELTPARG